MTQANTATQEMHTDASYSTINAINYTILTEVMVTSSLRLAQATALTFLVKAKGTADAYPTTEVDVAVRLLCLVLKGGAAHMPIEDKFDRLDIIARLDSGI